MNKGYDKDMTASLFADSSDEETSNQPLTIGTSQTANNQREYGMTAGRFGTADCDGRWNNALPALTRTDGLGICMKERETHTRFSHPCENSLLGENIRALQKDEKKSF